MRVRCGRGDGSLGEWLGGLLLLQGKNSRSVLKMSPQLELTLHTWDIQRAPDQRGSRGFEFLFIRKDDSERKEPTEA